MSKLPLLFLLALSAIAQQRAKLTPAQCATLANYNAHVRAEVKGEKPGELEPECPAPPPIDPESLPCIHSGTDGDTLAAILRVGRRPCYDGISPYKRQPVAAPLPKTRHHKSSPAK
jgi:hypothetical protein